MAAYGGHDEKLKLEVGLSQQAQPPYFAGSFTASVVANSVL
jgi:hypothetical protein